jgi:ABC-2 type transport system ATP-binding protein
VADVVIELVDLTKRYGNFTAVDSLNLSVRKGEVFGLLGPNGAGKSTTILMILGLTDPTSGRVKVSGIDSTTHPMEVKRKVGYLPEDVGFYDDYTGLENLMYTARLNRLSRKDARVKCEDLLRRIGLNEAMHKKAGKYSRGMRQRLGLADVLIKDPEVIILDEPTLGIDPKGVREFLDLIVELSKEKGLTVLFSSHHLHQMQQVCDRVGLFIGGKLLAEGNIQSLSQKLFSSNPYIIEAAVGGADRTTQWLTALLKHVEGIASIKKKNDLFEIESLRDITPDIARAIVQAGADLTYLNKKEYGLDEIYYRYFEGGVNHE